MVAQRSASFWDLSAATAASVVLWLLPAYSRLDARTQVITSSLALGASLYACHQSGRLSDAIKMRRVKRDIDLELTADWAELEYDRRLLLLKERYGLVEVERVEAAPELPQLEAEWEPVNPFMLSGEAGLLTAALADYGVMVQHVGEIAGPTFTRHVLKPGTKTDRSGKQSNVKVSEIANLTDEVQIALKLPEQPLISVVESGVAIDIPRKDRQILLYSDHIQPSSEAGPGDPVNVAIGVDLQNNLIELDLADPDNCHFGIGGATGGGKSGLIRCMLYSLIDRYSPALVKIGIFSEKASEYPDFNGGNPWMLRPLMSNPEVLLNYLDMDVVPEMEGRDNILKEADCKDVDTYNRLHSDTPLPHWVIVLDGYGEIIAQLKQSGQKAKAQDLELSLIRLAQRARTVGIHLVIATQRIDGKLLNPQLLSNLPVRICLKVRSKRDSELVCGESGIGGEKLLGKGDLLLLRAGRVARLQSPKVTDEQIGSFRKRFEGFEFDYVEPFPAELVEPAKKPKAEPTPTERFSREYLEFINSLAWQKKRAGRIRLDTVNGKIICQFCGKPCTDSDPPEVDHFRYPPKGSPVQAFIDQPIEDLRTLHKSCHALKTKRSRKAV